MQLVCVCVCVCVSVVNLSSLLRKRNYLATLIMGHVTWRWWSWSVVANSSCTMTSSTISFHSIVFIPYSLRTNNCLSIDDVTMVGYCHGNAEYRLASSVVHKGRRYDVEFVSESRQSVEQRESQYFGPPTDGYRPPTLQEQSWIFNERVAPGAKCSLSTLYQLVPESRYARTENVYPAERQFSIQSELSA